MLQNMLHNSAQDARKAYETSRTKIQRPSVKTEPVDQEEVKIVLRMTREAFERIQAPEFSAESELENAQNLMAKARFVLNTQPRDLNAVRRVNALLGKVAASINMVFESGDMEEDERLRRFRDSITNALECLLHIIEKPEGYKDLVMGKIRAQEESL